MASEAGAGENWGTSSIPRLGRGGLEVPGLGRTLLGTLWPPCPTPALQGTHSQNTLDPAAVSPSPWVPGRAPLLEAGPWASVRPPSAWCSAPHPHPHPHPVKWQSQLGVGDGHHRLCPQAGCSVESALEAASLHPAQLLGLEKCKGTLDFGADAGQGPTGAAWDRAGVGAGGPQAGTSPSPGASPGQGLGLAPLPHRAGQAFWLLKWEWQGCVGALLAALCCQEPCSQGLSWSVMGQGVLWKSCSGPWFPHPSLVVGAAAALPLPPSHRPPLTQTSWCSTTLFMSGPPTSQASWCGRRRRPGRDPGPPLEGMPSHSWTLLVGHWGAGLHRAKGASAQVEASARRQRLG